MQLVEGIAKMIQYRLTKKFDHHQNHHKAADCFDKYFSSISEKIDSSIRPQKNNVNISLAENQNLFDCIYAAISNLL